MLQIRKTPLQRVMLASLLTVLPFCRRPCSAKLASAGGSDPFDDSYTASLCPKWSAPLPFPALIGPNSRASATSFRGANAGENAL
jgi:hypothetical protein